MMHARFPLTALILISGVSAATRLMAAPATNAPPVFIAAFADESGGRAADGVPAAVRDLLLAALSDQGAVRLVDRDDLDRVLKEQELTLAGLSDPASGAKVGRLLGAERLVTGTVLPGEHGLAVVAHVLDVHTAVVQASCKAEGLPQALPEVVTGLARQLAAALHLPFDPGPAVRLETSPLASLHYLRGLGNLHAGNYDHAVMDFAICRELEMDNPAIHYWSARAYVELREAEHAGVEFKRFLEAAPQAAEADDARQRLDACEKQLRDNPPAALPAAMVVPSGEARP